MKKLLLITDPLPTGLSVQFSLLHTLIRKLASIYKITIFAPYIPDERVKELSNLGVIVARHRKFHHFLTYLSSRKGKENESLLWFDSWLNEVVFGNNSTSVQKSVSSYEFDLVLNLSYTVPYKSTLWWHQGTPVWETISSIRKGILTRIVAMLSGSTIRSMDRRLLRKMRSFSQRMILNSMHLFKKYSDLSFSPDGYVYSLKDFKDFYQTTENPTRDYVLIYLGKETDVVAVNEMIQAEMKIVCFGGKSIDSNLKFTNKRNVTLKGYVSQEELTDLFSNAMFTAFPFTDEPLGSVPVESMACGTPVLTYNKQGPSETVIHGRTGWLANDKGEFIKIAKAIWAKGKSGMSSNDCIERSNFFSTDRMISSLLYFLGEVSA